MSKLLQFNMSQAIDDHNAYVYSKYVRVSILSSSNDNIRMESMCLTEINKSTINNSSNQTLEMSCFYVHFKLKHFHLEGPSDPALLLAQHFNNR